MKGVVPAISVISLAMEAREENVRLEWLFLSLGRVDVEMEVEVERPKSARVKW